MNSSETSFSSVLLVDQAQDHKGILTNAAFVIGLSAGRLLPADTFGSATIDGDGSQHTELTKIAHFVRKTSQSKLRTLRQTILQNKDSIVVDYTEDAAPSDYSVYAQQLAQHRGEEISYRALYIYGPTEVIYPLTKNLSRLE